LQSLGLFGGLRFAADPDLRMAPEGAEPRTWRIEDNAIKAAQGWQDFPGITTVHLPFLGTPIQGLANQLGPVGMEFDGVQLGAGIALR